MNVPSAPSLTLAPIGIARTAFAEKADAPRQGTIAGEVEATLELYPGRGFEDALSDLATWERLWVVSWLDRADGWRPKVRPPRSSRKRGVFSTRAPHRPNPIGLTSARLVRVDGLRVIVRELDLLDRTPILDLKPYVPYADAFPDASHGWVGQVADPGPAWQVDFSPAAVEQLEFLESEGVSLRPRIEAALTLGPAPHAYRRIRELGDGVSELSVKSWRVRFRTEEERETMEVLEVMSGARPTEVNLDRPAMAAHRAFRARFGGAR